MPYTEQQKKEHIRELQTYLYGISLFDRRVPQVLPDGVYDRYTEEAVKAFQRAYGLPDTGETDSATWDRIAAIYRDYLDGAPAAYHVFPSRSYSLCTEDSLIRQNLNQRLQCLNSYPQPCCYTYGTVCRSLSAEGILRVCGVNAERDLFTVYGAFV